MACVAERAAIEALLRRRDVAPRCASGRRWSSRRCWGRTPAGSRPGRPVGANVRLWLARYARGGLDALADAPLSRAAGQGVPVPPAAGGPPPMYAMGEVIAVPVPGGPHHEYREAA